MAKETMIVFVYDTECCQDEADDPMQAVLYFHPSWVSDSQKLSLCGQLMGTFHFLSETFGKPKMIALQNGKFAIKEFGRFVLAVGTDRNLNRSALEHRANLLYSLVKLYHNNIQTIFDHFSANNQYKNLSEKLYHIFETYLPILQYNGNIFQNMPISKLPNCANNIFLDAMHTLQSCQRIVGVLGGAILFNNKIVATQLYAELMKNLILTDPHRIKTTASTIPVKFHVPIGCQLITIYMSNNEYMELTANAERARGMCMASEANTNNTPQFQFKKKLIKRDKSMVFNNPIPEETTDGACSTSTTVEINAAASDANTSSQHEDAVKIRPPSMLQRPNHLPLRFKNVIPKDIPESGFSSSITFDEYDSFPQFIGRTSVCSTPMTENKLLQGNIFSICADALDENNAAAEGIEEIPAINEQAKETTSAQHEQSSKSDAVNKLDTKFDEYPDSFLQSMPMSSNRPQRHNSLIDISGTFRKFIRQLSVKPLTNFMNDFDRITDGSKYHAFDVDAGDGFNKHHVQLNNLADRSHDYDGDVIDDIDHKHLYKTITDPTYPIFNSYGQPMSYFLFEEIYKNRRTTGNASSVEKPVVGKDVVNATVEKPVEPVLQSKDKPSLLPSSGSKNVNRKSLSLPLKSLTTPNGDASNILQPSLDSTDSRNILMKSEDRRRMSGIQLTPLITKLSILAMTDERSSGFSSWDATPGIEIATPIDSANIFRRRPSIKGDEFEQATTSDSSKSGGDTEIDNDQLRKVDLFVCGQNNMTMLLVLQENYAQKHENVQELFDVCISKLPRLEQNLSQILNININSVRADDGQYSYVYVDNEWDTLHRNGPWTNSDFSSMEQIRNDLQANPKLRSIIVRGDESVIYGHQNIASNIFYKQSAQTICGLPAPVDAMGTVSKHAQRNLERDHSIILF